MKSLAFALFIFLTFASQSEAQTDQWTVKAGEEIKDAIPLNVRYRYPQFVSGMVYFKNGTQSEGRLNLNLLNEEMQFINPAADTLSIDNEATIKYITIESDTFYYSKRRYLELISRNASIQLAKKERLKIGEAKKIGGYDQPSPTSAITSVSRIYQGTEVADLKQRAELLLVKETIYYIGDKYNNFLEANRKNLVKMFGRQEVNIDHFLKENKIRFYKEDDLKMLINFLAKTLK